MEKTVASKNTLSENLRVLADLIEAIENEAVTPEMQRLAQEVDAKALAPPIQTAIRMVAGTGPSMLDYMNADFRAELEQALDTIHN